MEPRETQQKERTAPRPDVEARARAIQRRLTQTGAAAPERGAPAARPQAAGGGPRSGRPTRAGSPAQTGNPTRTGNPARTGNPTRTGNSTQTGSPLRIGNPAQTGSPPRTGSPTRTGAPGPGRRGGRHYTARPRSRRRAPGGGLFFAASFAVILGLAWVITAVIEAPARRAEAASRSAASAAQSAPEHRAAQAGPTPQSDGVYTPPSAALLALPEAGRVEMRYFDDALFIGDSLTRGFQEYASGIPNAKYAAYIGVGPRQLMEGTVENKSGAQVAAIDEILAAAPRKVYLLLGTNSMATLTDEAFLKYYSDFLDFLLPQLPADTVYYLQAIPPVTAAKMEADANFSAERIRGLNEALAKLAYEKGLYFLDLFSALADDTGALRADIASGDIHLNNSGYSLWREFLITHTAYRRDNPYLPGSPYYLAPAE